MATDWTDYAHHMMAVMAENPAFQNLAANGKNVPRPEGRPLTRFEQRGTRLGHEVWDLMYQRI